MTVRHAGSLCVCLAVVLSSFSPPLSASALGQVPPECFALFQAHMKAFENGQWERAVATGRQFLGRCRSFLETDVEAGALHFIGVALLELRNYDDAVPLLKRCVSMQPDSSACLYNLGQCLEELEQLEPAASYYRNVIDLGGYDELSARYVRLARLKLARLETRLQEAEKRGSERASSRPPRSTAPLLFGTGFFVTEKGHILTNRHVVQGCRSIKTRDQHELEIVAVSEDADLALLRGDLEPPSVAVFRSGPALKLGEPVVAFGYPLPGLLSAKGNVSSGTISALSGLQDDNHFLQVSAPVQPGDSGGPLLDESGNVIGVVVGKLDSVKIAAITGDIPQNVNFAVHLAAVKTFLSDSQVFYKRKVSAAAAKVVDVAAAARSFSLALSCEQ